MKKSVLTQLFTITLLLVAFTGFSQTAERLFHIARNQDKDLVCYDVCLKNGVIDKEKAIRGYWQKDKDSSTHEFSLVQRKLAFGFTIKNITDTEVEFLMTAYNKRSVKVVYDQAAKHYYAQMTIDGKSSRLSRICFRTSTALRVCALYRALRN